jgi:uncharacterized damage-inducible protein DinB
MTPAELFLRYSTTRLNEQAGRICACLDRLTPEQVWTRNSENENAIGNLILHLCGNVRQYIGFGVAGRPDVRVRDREFSTREGPSIEDLKQRLEATVRDAVAVISSTPAERLTDSTHVQGRDWAVLEAIYQVVDHFSVHTGQILFATKLWTGADLGFSKQWNVSPPSP